MVKLWRDENVGIKYFSSTDLSMFRRETSPIIRPARAASSRARIRDPARMQTTSPVSDSSIGVDDDGRSDEVSLDGLQVELEECKDDNVVANILVMSSKLREYAEEVENNVHQDELNYIQDEIGSISSEIKSLQEKSMDMGLKLKNLKGAESKLARFLEDINIPPRLIDIIVDGEVNDEYMKNLESVQEIEICSSGSNGEVSKSFKRCTT